MKKRLDSIDSLRGLAVVLMFVHHFPKWLMIDAGKENIAYVFFVLISRFAAPLFLLIVGLCMVLSSQKRKEKAVQHLMMRGAFLFFSGYLINLMVYRDFFSLNILHTIGLSIIIFSLFSVSKKIRWTILAVALMAMISPLLSDTGIEEIFFFPILPWGLFTGLGVILGQLMITYPQAYDLDRYRKEMEASITALLILSFIAFHAFYPATWAVFAAAATFFIYLSALIYQKTRGAIMGPFKTYGVYAYQLYFVHLFFAVTIPGQLGMLNSLTGIETMAVLFLFLYLSWIILEIVRSYSSKARQKQMLR